MSRRLCSRPSLNRRLLGAQEVDFKEKKKWKFMQKYWHKGAYYQTGADDQFQEANVDEIFKRDFSGATGEDKFDRSILPKIMQVGRPPAQPPQYLRAQAVRGLPSGSFALDHRAEFLHAVGGVCIQRPERRCISCIRADCPVLRSPFAY